jgi:hypothetical protein
LRNTVVEENVQGETNVYFGENIAQKEKHSDLEIKNCDLEVIQIMFPRHITKQKVHWCILQYPSVALVIPIVLKRKESAFSGYEIKHIRNMKSENLQPELPQLLYERVK